MAATEVPQIPEILDSDDLDDPGTFGLHLGLLRRWASLAFGERTAPDTPASEQ